MVVGQASPDLEHFATAARSASLEALLTAAPANVQGKLKAQVAFEGRARAGRLTGDERDVYIRSWLLTGEHLIRMGPRRPLERRTLGGALFLILALFAAIIWIVLDGWRQYLPAKFVIGVPVTWAALSLLGAVWMSISNEKRFASGRLIPFLAKKLSVVQPQPREIEQALTTARGNDWKIGAMMPVERLIAECQKASRATAFGV